MSNNSGKHPELAPDRSVRVDLSRRDDHARTSFAQANNRPIKHGAMLPEGKRLVFGARAHPDQFTASRGNMENPHVALTQDELDRVDLTGTSISINHGRGKRIGEYAENGEVIASARGDDGSVYTLNAMNRDNSGFGEDMAEVERVMQGIKEGSVNKVSLRIDSRVDTRSGQIVKRVFPELSVMKDLNPAFPQCDIFTDYDSFPPDVQRKLMAKLMARYTPQQLASLGISVPLDMPDVVQANREFRDIVMAYAEHAPSPRSFTYCDLPAETAPASASESASASAPAPQAPAPQAPLEAASAPMEVDNTPSSEPVAEPVAEPVVEPVEEPVAEPVAEPVVEPVVEEAKAPTPMVTEPEVVKPVVAETKAPAPVVAEPEVAKPVVAETKAPVSPACT